jgi:hypothetical protein
MAEEALGSVGLKRWAECDVRRLGKFLCQREALPNENITRVSNGEVQQMTIAALLDFFPKGAPRCWRREITTRLRTRTATPQ